MTSSSPPGLPFSSRRPPTAPELGLDGLWWQGQALTQHRSPQVRIAGHRLQRLAELTHQLLYGDDEVAALDQLEQWLST